MDNRVRLAMEANRKYVQEGLDRRRLNSQLKSFEDAMIKRCNEKYDEACLQNRLDAAVNHSLEQSKARIAERAEKREKAEQTRKSIALASYICGMSVPPVMIKRIVQRLIESGVFSYKGVPHK